MSHICIYILILYYYSVAQRVTASENKYLDRLKVKNDFYQNVWVKLTQYNIYRIWKEI